MKNTRAAYEAEHREIRKIKREYAESFWGIVGVSFVEYLNRRLLEKTTPEEFSALVSMLADQVGDDLENRQFAYYAAFYFGKQFDLREDLGL